MKEPNSDERRESMLSVPARWSELYFTIFAAICVGGEGFVIYYGIFRRPPDADALDVAANILLLLAAVPLFAALQAYLAMRGRDLAMKTWETFSRERFNSGVAVGREEGREEGRELLISEIRERLARREASERSERDDWLDEILSELSENGGGKNGRPRN